MSHAAILNSQVIVLPPALEAAASAAAASWTHDGKVARFWNRDASLWTSADESRWMGWLDAPASTGHVADDAARLAADVRREAFTHVLLLGMGGSSLAPEVMRLSFGVLPGAPDLAILDSTDPAQVLAAEARCDLARTLVVVASKSGSTLEPNVFYQYIHARMVDTVGAASAGRHFVAITDPGSKMQQVAERDGFRRVFFGDPTIGGRFSALSPFGLVPAALMGVELPHFIAHARLMVEACRADVADANPGVALGLALGSAARAGRDKLTVVASPAVVDLGAWLEQLVAESTGKRGRAIIPVDLERRRAATAYGDDRVFVSLAVDGDVDAARESWLDGLESAGHPVIRIGIAEGAYGLAQEFFRWEVATAVACAVTGVNPFDQPDVESAKVATKGLTSAFESSGVLPGDAAFYEEAGIRFHADAANTEALRLVCGPKATARDLLDAHVARTGAGDYVALLAYVEMNARHAGLLADIRELAGHRTGAATCLGFGPRFLHSTGQAYKGGPPTGVFLQFTADDARDADVPGQKFSFGVVKAAQALGDLQVLNARGRRALRVHLGRDVAAGLAQVARWLGAPAPR